MEHGASDGRGHRAGVHQSAAEEFCNGLHQGACEVTLSRAIARIAIGVFVIGGFVLGVLLVWLYAAIRPRFGPGPKTSLIAGLVLWFLAYACHLSARA